MPPDQGHCRRVTARWIEGASWACQLGIRFDAPIGCDGPVDQRRRCGARLGAVAMRRMGAAHRCALGIGPVATGSVGSADRIGIQVTATSRRGAGSDFRARLRFRFALPAARPRPCLWRIADSDESRRGGRTNARDHPARHAGRPRRCASRQGRLGARRRGTSQLVRIGCTHLSTSASWNA